MWRLRNPGTNHFIYNLEEMIFSVEDVDKAEDEDGGHVEGEGDQEHEEIPVVPPS